MGLFSLFFPPALERTITADLSIPEAACRAPVELLWSSRGAPVELVELLLEASVSPPEPLAD